jgi:hypothetical protein
MVREKILVVRVEIWTLFAIFMFIILLREITVTENPGPPGWGLVRWAGSPPITKTYKC